MSSEPSPIYEGEHLSVVTSSAVIRGAPQRFEWVGRPNIVIGVPLTSDHRLVLVRQYRPALDRFILELPAGKVGDERPESQESALRRELREEVGFAVTDLQGLGTLLTAPHFSNESADVFLALGDVVALPAPTPKEDLWYELVTLQQADELIRRGDINDSKSIAALALLRVAEYFK